MTVVKNWLIWGLQVPITNLVHQGEDFKLRMIGMARWFKGSHQVQTIVQETARGAQRRPTPALYYPPPYYVVRQSWNRTGPHSLPFSSVLYSSLRLWERISLWQCREYQGKPNEALLCKRFGAVFIPDGIVWDFRPLWRAVSRNIDWKNGFTTAKEATLNQTNA